MTWETPLVDLKRGQLGEGMWVGGLGSDGVTRPFASERLKRAILRPPKAFWLIVEDGMWVPGFGADGGIGPFCNEPCNETMLS